MADTTSMFIVGVYHYYKWTGQKDLLDKLWPACKKAITWLMVDSTHGKYSNILTCRRLTGYLRFVCEKQTRICENIHCSNQMLTLPFTILFSYV